MLCEIPRGSDVFLMHKHFLWQTRRSFQAAGGHEDLTDEREDLTILEWGKRRIEVPNMIICIYIYGSCLICVNV